MGKLDTTINFVSGKSEIFFKFKKVYKICKTTYSPILSKINDNGSEKYLKLFWNQNIEFYDDETIHQ